MKKGYHSTQRKYFGTIPRTAFLGLALGYGVGMFLSGLLHMENQTCQLVCLAIGVGIGYWLDNKYFAEKDLTEEEIEALEAAERAAEAQESEDGSEQDEEESGEEED